MACHRMLTSLFADAAGVHGDPLALVEVQPRVGGAIADLVLTFEGGTMVVVEVQVESAADEAHLESIEAATPEFGLAPRFVMLGLGEGARPKWRPLTWFHVVEAIEDNPDPVAQQFTTFILRDILGLRRRSTGAGNHDQPALRTWRRRHSASPGPGGPVRQLRIASHQRPLSLPGHDLRPSGYRDGLLDRHCERRAPLSEHYHLMLASKESPILEPSIHPRATGDWKWQHWTGAGRIVRPVTAEDYTSLLARLPA